jgi:hypothetical protein
MEKENFVWTIAQLERTKEDDMVFSVHYRLSLSCGDCFVETYGTVGLPPADPENKIPYEELSEEIVINWIFGILGEDTIKNIKESLVSQLEYTKNPPKESGIPWKVEKL